jgi:hypothetical protein
LRYENLFPIILQSIYQFDDHFEAIILMNLFLKDKNNLAFFDSQSIEICLKQIEKSFHNYQYNLVNLEILASVLEYLIPIYGTFNRKSNFLTKDLIELLHQHQQDDNCLKICYFLIQLFPQSLILFEPKFIQGIFIQTNNFKILLDFISEKKMDEQDLVSFLKI